MELRHLDTMLAIADYGSFTAAADVLMTVQSNVSEVIRQLEQELGVELLVRARRGTVPTEFGTVVIERARRIRREMEALQVDVSMLQGLHRGSASLGIVGTASRWLMPDLVRDLRASAPGVRIRVTEAASERLVADVVTHELAQAIVTEPISDRRVVTEALLEEPLVALIPDTYPADYEPKTLADLAIYPLVMPPVGNPLRSEIEAYAAREGVDLNIPIEVEGVRLIADLVAGGIGVAIVPETTIPSDLAGLRPVLLERLPPRRLALAYARDARLSLADQAVRQSVRALMAAKQKSVQAKTGSQL
ncbi:MAG: LysR family transcriptional regulator [Acidimicrobiia bacterium]